MTTLFKDELQEHYSLYFPKEFVKELEMLGACDVESAKKVIKENYIKKVFKYILNDYKLVDEMGVVKIEGSILITDHEHNLYSNSINKNFKDYMSMGTIDALFKAFKTELEQNIEIVHYGSAAIGNVDSECKVMTIMGIIDKDTQKVYWGVGESTNALQSAVDSLLSVINRMEMLKSNESR